MSELLPDVYLARHGETAWTINHKHTGLTDLPLTERGVRNARSLGERLEGTTFSHVFSSPLQRADYTCELAGFGEVAAIDPDLLEWDYGDYEGLTTAEIVKKRPGWNIFDDGCPGGESLADVTARADRMIGKLRGSPRRRRPALFQQSFPPRPDRSLAGVGSRRRPLFLPRHRHFEYARLRPRQRGAGRSSLERRPPRGSIKGGVPWRFIPWPASPHRKNCSLT